MDYLKKVKAIEEEIIQNRRELHERAEVGFDTPKTLSFIKEKLSSYGYQIEEMGRAGVRVCIDKGTPFLMLRADIDGLPIEEKTGLSYACKSGNMHACGHDMHTAILLGVARLLKENERLLTQSVILFFQTAEERLEGAKTAIKNGLFDKEISSAVTLHVMVGSNFESGSVIVPTGGVVAPSADYFTVEIEGKACHGSAPQDGVDATLIGSHLLLSMQSLITREVGGRSLAVMTVGRFQSGSAGNVISQKAELEGTLRTLDEPIRELLKTRLVELAKQTAKAFKGKASVKFTSGCPSLLIDEEVSKNLKTNAEKALGKQSVIDFERLPKGGIGGSEDFAYISREVPSATFALCAGKREDGYNYPLHHSKVQFDETALAYGSAVLFAFAMEN